MESKKQPVNPESELDKFIDRVIEMDKKETGNPFLAERVMSEIRSLDAPVRIPVYSRLFQMAAIAAGFALIVFLGINMGSFAGKQLSERNEIVLLNDAHMERIELLLTD